MNFIKKLSTEIIELGNQIYTFNDSVICTSNHFNYLISRISNYSICGKPRNRKHNSRNYFTIRGGWNVPLLVRIYSKYYNWTYKETTNTGGLQFFIEKYFQHLKDDIRNPIVENLKNHENWSVALASLSKPQRRIIIEHFFTAEKSNRKYDGLFSLYEKAVWRERDTTRKVYGFYWGVSKMNIDYWEFYNSGIKLEMPDKEVFDKIFCVSKNHSSDITKDMIDAIKNSVYDFSEFSIRPKDDDQWIIHFKNKDVFQINSREVGLQIVQKYNERFKEMKEIANECQKNIDMRIFWDFANHNKLLETVLEKIKIGEPIIGACDACLRYFPDHERNSYDKLLTKFVDEQVNAKDPLF